MSLAIEHFEIGKLHGTWDIFIPIKDDRIILVGVNGLGKTTVINLLYYFLTQQWPRLVDYEFEYLAVQIGGTKLKLSRDDVASPLNTEFLQEELFAFIPSRVVENVSPSMLRRAITDLSSGSVRRLTPQLSYWARRLDVPPSFLLRIAERARNKFREDPKASKNLQKITQTISKAFSGQILYLPTYRRIEQDLKAIFPELQEEVGRLTKERLSRGQEGEAGYIEFVHFGMEDVDHQIRSVLLRLKESARIELNNLSGSYLRDVIRDEAQTYDKVVIGALDDAVITTILNRIEEKTVSQKDKTSLRKVISKIKEGKNLKSSEKYLAHFFSKLVGIYESQKPGEEAVAKFVSVCNRYLRGKRFLYDEVNFQLALVLDNNEQLELRALSSGEKQIVSLFSHLYLSSTKSFVLLIDEPELSLSVPWQKTFLQDVVATGRCEFLAAVTHSPFVFDNELDKFAQDLSVLIKESR